MSMQEQGIQTQQQDPDGVLRPDDAGTDPGSGSATNQPLLSADDGEGFKDRWEQIQVRFVDEPQASVKEADALVTELMQRLADRFAQERGRLESQWERGEEASTEDLRTALQQYRSFFRRLLVA
jgi:hypothetical protein